MSAALKSISQCFNGLAPQGYQALPVKKDDDAGVEQARLWVQNNPVQKRISIYPEKIQKYADNIIQGLKKIPINNSNYSLISDHLKAISYYSNAAKNRLVERLDSVSGDKALILLLKSAVATCWSEEP